MIKERILFVDDDPNILAAFKRGLRKSYEVYTAPDGASALKSLAGDVGFAIIVADMKMPGMDGVDFLRAAQEIAPDPVRLMLTGNADQKTAVDAVNQGHIFSFLTKPCPIEVLEAALANALKQYHLIRSERELLEHTLNRSVEVLTEVLSMSDPDAFGLGERLCHGVRALASRFPVANVWELELAAMLSQIGYVAIPPKLVEKARAGAALSLIERQVLMRVPEIGARLIARIPRLDNVAKIIRYQNKNFDGTGFPVEPTSGHKIPVGARILKVLADLLMAEDGKKSRFEIMQRMNATHGKYDPKVLQAVAGLFDIALGKSMTERAKVVYVPFSALERGGFLAADVRSKDGLLLVKSGAEVSAPLLEKLRNFKALMGICEPIAVRQLEGTKDERFGEFLGTEDG